MGMRSYSNFVRLSAVRTVAKAVLFIVPAYFQVFSQSLITSLCSAFLPVEQVGTEFTVAFAVGWR